MARLVFYDFDFTMADWSPEKEQCTYTACYCEENVWKLCEQFKSHRRDIDTLYVVFISSHERMIALWKQKAGDSKLDHLAVWDYHVILLLKEKNDKKALVYDLDSVLPFPVEACDYVRVALRPGVVLRVGGWPGTKIPDKSYRVIPGETYLQEFASDRSHMVKKDGGWIADPPTYPAIASNNSTNNIQEFISMDPSSLAPGQVMSEEEFTKTFS